MTTVTSLAFPRSHPTDPNPFSILEGAIELANTTVQASPSRLPAPLIHTGEPYEEKWNIAVHKGQELIDQMLASDKEAGRMSKERMDSAESKFLDFPSDLDKWGYSTLEWDDYYDFDTSIPIKNALQGLGADTRTKEKGGANRAFNWEHEDKKTIGGIEYMPTHAYFIMVMNPLDGVIISLGSYGPAYMGGKQNPKVTVLPKLKAWSDITFLQWHGLHGGKDEGLTRSIKYILRALVENEDTQGIIKQALSRTKHQLGRWPGVTFNVDSEEGKALLGSPNGLGTAFMLIQHKRQLGTKTIDKVTVFQDDGNNLPGKPRPPSLVFHVKDAPTPKEVGEHHNRDVHEDGKRRMHVFSNNRWRDLHRV